MSSQTNSILLKKFAALTGIATASVLMAWPALASFSSQSALDNRLILAQSDSSDSDTGNTNSNTSNTGDAANNDGNSNNNNSSDSSNSNASGDSPGNGGAAGNAPINSRINDTREGAQNRLPQYSNTNPDNSSNFDRSDRSGAGSGTQR